MGRTAPRGRLRVDQQAAASTAHPDQGIQAQAGVARRREGTASTDAVHAHGARPQQADSSSLPPEELTLHVECVKLTGERLPLGVAYPRFLDVVRRVVPFEHGTLHLAEGTGGSLVPVVVKGNRVDLADQVRFAKGPGLTAWVAQEGRPVVIPHPVHSVDQRPFADKGLRAFAAIPLMEQGRVVAVLALTRAEHVFEAQEFDFLVKSGGRLAATLSRMRLQAQYRMWTQSDEETGLSARHRFLARLDTEIVRARTNASEFAVFVITLDGGSRHGPESIGRFTRAFAQRLRNSIRSCDMATLMDDGSFGVLLAGVNRATAERILARIATTALQGNHGLSTGAVTVWGGVAACSDAITPADEFLARARGSLVRVA